MSLQNRLSKLERQLPTGHGEDKEHVIFDDGAGYVLTVPARMVDGVTARMVKIYGQPSGGGGLLTEKMAA